MSQEDIWLIGAGSMAQDYIKVLAALKKSFLVIGRGEETAKACEISTGCSVVRGGLAQFISSVTYTPAYAIIATGVEKLFETTKLLLEHNVKNILVEKPGALYNWEFEELNRLAKEKNAHVFIAYNRRFYASTLKANEIIQQDGGITTFNFEFTEWAHEIEPLQKGEGVKDRWFLANSTHVVDLAFYLGGQPKEICSFTSGTLDWHKSASIFSGAGVSQTGALFNYQANWESAGRWSLEVLTKEHRLIFRPMEKLQIQKRGSVQQNFVEIDYTLDEDYKPGLYLQTKNFIENMNHSLCTLSEQLHTINIYNKIANYQ